MGQQIFPFQGSEAITICSKLFGVRIVGHCDSVRTAFPRLHILWPPRWDWYVQLSQQC